VTRGQPVYHEVWSRAVSVGAPHVPEMPRQVIDTPLKWLVAVALTAALTACGGSEYVITSPDASYGQPEAATALPATSGPADLLELLDAARADWADAGLTEQVHVPFVAWADDIGLACAYGGRRRLLGCYQDGGIYMNTDYQPTDDLALVMRHELGHALRLTGGHLPCSGWPGDALMCDGGNGSGEVTQRDVAFVLRQAL
jgi:hypothetical protein